jgi:hypothetical protein
MTIHVYLLIRAIITEHITLLPLAITFSLLRIYAPLRQRSLRPADKRTAGVSL